MLELAILGLLKEQDLHGYELKKRLAETLGGGSGVSFGSLYPALARLEAAAAVQAVEGDGDGGLIPGTGSLGGELAAFRARKGAVRGSRGKKVYGITQRGELLFEELLAAESSANDDERVFHLRLAFARYLPHDARLGLLERRRAYLLERLAHTHTAIRNGWERLDAYTRSLLEHGHETTERDISWLDRLIAREREAGPDPVPGAPADPGRDPGVAVVSLSAAPGLTRMLSVPTAPRPGASITPALPVSISTTPALPVSMSTAAPSASTVPAMPAATQEGTTP